MGRDLRYVSLNTGRTRRYKRSDVGSCVDTGEQLLREVLTGGEGVVPGIGPALVMSATNAGNCLTVRLRRADARMRPPVLTLGIARNGCGSELWDALHADSRGLLATRKQPCPSDAWCAERIDGTGTLDVSNEWGTLENFELCIAWAFLDRPGRPNDV